MTPKFQIEIHIHDTEGEKALRAVLREDGSAQRYTCASSSFNPGHPHDTAHAVSGMLDLLGRIMTKQLRTE